MQFDIYRNGELVEQGVMAADTPFALIRYAEENGVEGPVKRDGCGGLYIGDAAQGRFYARRVATKHDREAVEAWQAQYPGIPFGIPAVLAESIKSVGGLS